MTDDSPRITTPARTDSDPADRSIDLVAIPDDPDAPAKVTFVPDDPGDERLTTAWITADAADVVDLDECR